MRRILGFGIGIVTVAAAAWSWYAGREPALLPVTLPDLSRSDEPVRRQILDEHAVVMAKLEAHAPRAERAEAFGRLGMLLHAAEYLDAAEAAYRNAETLAPQVTRWAYFLGHVYRGRGDTARAIEALARVVERQPADVAALVWLGRLYLDSGQPDAAEPLFVQAQRHAPRAVAVLAGLGQVALARRDYGRAASLFEEALSIDPKAASLWAPLAAAHRGLGDPDKAEALQRRWRNTEIPLADPLSEELGTVLRSAAAYDVRGVRALESGRYAEAAEIFREGLTLAPRESPIARSMRHKRALALHLAGDVSGATRELEEAIRLAPASGRDEPAAQAHYALAIMTAAQGRDDRAVELLMRATRYDEQYVQAYTVLGDLERRRGRFEASLAHYRTAVDLDPMAAAARLGYGLSLVRLHRYVQARAWLEEAVRAQPDRPELAHALARILAAAPDARARDGRRAMTIAARLLDAERRTDYGETMAMALAEAGQYEQAAAVQQEVLEAATRARLDRDVRRMRANLARYLRRQPCRTPWPADDAIHRPGPPAPGL